MTFAILSTPRRVAADRFSIEVPDGWQQGRGAFGGLVLAMLVRAVEAFAEAPQRPLRTITAELCGPVLPGPAEIRVEALRLGSGTSTVAARLVQGDAVQTHAVMVLGRDRDPEPATTALPRPEMPPWREVAELPVSTFGPTFARYLEYRSTGPVPLVGGSEARAAGWVRPRAPGTARDAAYITALADAYWPALFGILPAPRPMATITFTLDLVGTCDGLDPEAPLFHDGRTLVARDGYAPEMRTLWGEDGRLLAINHQTIVVIR